jgi:hypothetical protein
MFARLMTGLAILTFLSVDIPQACAAGEESAVLKRLGDIERRLGKIERELQQLTVAVRRLPGGEAALDVRESPEYKRLEARLKELQEKLGAEPLRDSAEIWRIMGDPKELSQRLDKLGEAFAPTITDANRRSEFEQDILALKKKIGEEVSEEELYERVRKRLSERLEKSTSDREKAWLRRLLEELEKSSGQDRKEMLSRYVRFENMKAVHELARKYSVPRELMVESGLGFIGPGPRAPRHRGGPERNGPGRGAPRGNPRERRRP